MRDIKTKEARKRGCKYCIDARPNNSNRFGMSKFGCTHEECPYHVLDESDDYEAWLKQTEPAKIPWSRKKLMYL